MEFSICTKRGFSLTGLVGWLVGWVGLVTKLGGLVGCFFVKQVQN